MKLQNTNINFHVIKNSEWMENILLVLMRHFIPVSAQDLEAYYYEGKTLKNACHITIDDGDISVYTHLFPLIKKYRVPISIYVSPHAVRTGKNFWFQEIKEFDYQQFLEFYAKQKGEPISYINKHQVSAILKSMKVADINALISDYKKAYDIPDRPRVGMNLEQILELKASGLVTIGAHTLNHPILKNEDDETTGIEILRSVEELSDMLQENITCFAYPNGLPGLDFGEREMNYLKEADIKLAFSTESKHFSQADHPLSIPRRGITKGGAAFVFAKLAMGDYWDKLKEVLKGKEEKQFRYQ